MDKPEELHDLGGKNNYKKLQNNATGHSVTIFLTSRIQVNKRHK